ncbi:DUF2569 domain-containing protein [Burkholderia multivorans]|uniref:DUF2569 family protein n=1 Tax=Burkholderia multivorans TaxID=87883 RepID=UPI00143EE2CE|nr:DUF2569 family protein [Burkholderia multivorans]QIX17195.1 DUF2569 domain-containing protein [Burkholderia multivorans]UQP01367.1 DUF2569 domain-containing protein [Burkholderia multivorans]
MGTSLETKQAPENIIREPSGIGGWLTFFVISAILIGPIFAVLGTFSSFAQAERVNAALVDFPAWSAYKQAGWIVVGLRIFMSIGVGLMLIDRKIPISVTLTKWVLWIGGPLFGLLDLYVLVPYVLGVSVPPERMPEYLGGVLGSAITAGVWHAYFSRSKRVRNTYYT